MRTRFLLLLLSLCIAATLRADPPEGPLLRAPGDFARWQVVSTYAAKAPKKDRAGRRAKGTPATAPADARLQKLVTTKTGQIVHEERTDLAGHTTEVWYDRGTQYTKAPGVETWLRADAKSGDPSYQPLPEIGYRGVNLVRPENYVATLPYGQRPCLVFVSGAARKANWANPPAAEKQLKALESVALVDAETRLPVEIRAGGETRTFQFDPPPDSAQTLPDDLLDQAKEGDAARARLDQPAPRPY